MTDESRRALAEIVFERGAGEREPSDALKLEEKRRAAVVENMLGRADRRPGSSSK